LEIDKLIDHVIKEYLFHNIITMKENKKMNSLTILLVLAIGVSLTFSFIPSADAIGNKEYEPTQPNAFASYNNATNQVQVEWDFTTNDSITGTGAPTTCLLKGDFWYYTDLANEYDVEGVDNADPLHADYQTYTRISAFIPIHYSVVSSNPTIINTISEVIPCSGNTKIDLNSIMSNSLNTLNHLDLEIFLTFYVPDADGNLNVANAYRIDEVFVMYTPNSIFEEHAYGSNYGCDGQIGSTLYIDASGSNGSVIAHGDNGDNCGNHLYVENHQWVDISMEPNDGNVTKGSHENESYPLLIKVINYQIASEKKGGGCGGDCSPPTFGKDKKGQMIVQGGFSFNGNSTDVIEFWTPYHMITAQTNSTHNFTLKAFENYGNNNIKWFQFGIVPEVGSELNDAEVLATIYISSSQVEKIEIEEAGESNLIDIINATSYIEECGYVTSDCLELSLDIIFREELKNKVIVIQAMDNSRNANTKFLNDGIETVGESMNEPLISYVLASKGGAFYPQDRGVVELTLTSYKNDLWQDQYGYEWSTNNYGFYIINTVPVPLKEPDVMWQAMTRMNSNFADMIIYEQERAVLIFDASKLVFLVKLLHMNTTYNPKKTIKQNLQ